MRQSPVIISLRQVIGFDGDVVVLDGLGIFTLTEVQVASVVMDIGVVRYQLQCFVEVIKCVGLLDFRLHALCVAQLVDGCRTDSPLPIGKGEVRIDSNGRGQVVDSITKILHHCVGHRPLQQQVFGLLHVRLLLNLYRQRVCKCKYGT